MELVRLNARLPASLHRRLRAVAAMRGVTMETLVRELLESGLEEDQ